MQILINNAGYLQKIHVQPCTRCHLATRYYEGAGRSGQGAQTQGCASTRNRHSALSCQFGIIFVSNDGCRHRYGLFGVSICCNVQQRVIQRNAQAPWMRAAQIQITSRRTQEDKKGAKKQQEKNTCPHCKKFYHIKPHHVSEDKCMWKQKYKGYRFKSICDKLEVAFKHRHIFVADSGGYSERDSNSSGSD
jgi:hypothetical protein